MIGIGFSTYESQLITDNLTSQQQTIAAGANMKVIKFLDPVKNKNGVYSVQITDFKDVHVKVTVYDPQENIILSKPIAQNPYQDNFTVPTSGNYTLQIENNGGMQVQAIGTIGNYPQNVSWLDIFSFVILIVGLGGLAIGVMYFIKMRGRTNIS